MKKVTLLILMFFSACASQNEYSVDRKSNSEEVKAEACGHDLSGLKDVSKKKAYLALLLAQMTIKNNIQNLSALTKCFDENLKINCDEEYCQVTLKETRN